MTEPLEQEDAVRWLSELGQTGTTVHRDKRSASALEPGKWFFRPTKTELLVFEPEGKTGRADGRFAFGSFTTDLGQLCAAAVTVRLLEVRTDCDEES
jgi:hypothetical protein